MFFIILISEYEYICGSFLLLFINVMFKKVMCRFNINCGLYVELVYYGSGLG